MYTRIRFINYLCKRTFQSGRPIFYTSASKNIQCCSHSVYGLFGTSTTRKFATLDTKVSNDDIIKPQVEKYNFQAETRQLLDIVARSLYSDKEVFVRELVSNASDALEKFRYLVLANADGTECIAKDRPLEIKIITDKPNMQLIIEDTGIGMTRDELVSNLGTIARSGSKKFLDELNKSVTATESSSNIIGQFGVGFYSAFIVADKVEVFSRSAKVGSPGLLWTTDGSGTFEIREVDNIEFGTRIVLTLKTECREFADQERIKAIIRKYSNFVGAPILVNGTQANDIKPIWLMDQKDISKEQHDEFYRFIANTFDTPEFVLHYKADVPIRITALLYFPGSKPGLFEMSREGSAGIALYSRKVLIQSKAQNVLPKWLRFVKGVVDSEDIPLNLSRELLQNSSLIKKLSDVITSRVLRFLYERAKKQPEEYKKFYYNYGLFLKEGIITSNDNSEKESIAKLLRFESSQNKDTHISLDDYCKDVGLEQKNIYYLAAPNRSLAESSPYYESLKKRNTHVLFCYEPYDELVLMQLREFQNKRIVSVEKQLREDMNEAAAEDSVDGNSLTRAEVTDLTAWLQRKLNNKVSKVNATSRLDAHPCVLTVEEMGAARHFIRTQGQENKAEDNLALLQAELQINPKHEIIKKLYKIKSTDTELAELLAEQLFANALVGAGLAQDARILLLKMNDLLTKALEKY